MLEFLREASGDDGRDAQVFKAEVEIVHNLGDWTVRERHSSGFFGVQGKWAELRT